MGLFDQVVGSITGQASGGEDSMLGNIMQMIGNSENGGLAGLVQAFQNGGLGEVVNSWVSNGHNLPISADQIQSALGNEQIQNLAGKLGISTDEASGKLAELLPQLVDKLTPNGAVPADGDVLSQGMELLKGKLFGQ